MDFITGLPPARFGHKIVDAILVIVDRIHKICSILSGQHNDRRCGSSRVVLQQVGVRLRPATWHRLPSRLAIHKCVLVGSLLSQPDEEAPLDSVPPIDRWADGAPYRLVGRSPASLRERTLSLLVYSKYIDRRRPPLLGGLLKS